MGSGAAVVEGVVEGEAWRWTEAGLAVSAGFSARRMATWPEPDAPHAERPRATTMSTEAAAPVRREWERGMTVPFGVGMPHVERPGLPVACRTLAVRHRADASGGRVLLLTAEDGRAVGCAEDFRPRAAASRRAGRG